MEQQDIVQAFRDGRGRYSWTEVTGMAGVEVMSRPARVGEEYVAVSAQTSQQCADILSDLTWLVRLSSVSIEDWVWDHAAVKPPPLLISPQQLNIACPAAIDKASKYLAKQLEGVLDDGLVAYGKNWIHDAALATHPGRAANYGMPDPNGRYASANGLYKLWQPLSFCHDAQHYDYSQLLRLVRVRRGAEAQPLPEHL